MSFKTVSLLLLGAALTGCSTMSTSAPPALHTVQHVDLDRYMGRWYVISHVPNFFEKDKVGTSDNYALRPDGRLDNVFVFRKGSLDAPEKSWKGIAWVTNTASNAEWKVRLFWPFTADYLLLELDPNYQWAVACNQDGKLFWVLARETSLPDNVYQEILTRIRHQGLDPSKLENVPQLKAH